MGDYQNKYNITGNFMEFTQLNKYLTDEQIDIKNFMFKEI